MTAASVTGPKVSTRSIHLTIYTVFLTLALLAAPLLGVIGVRTLLDSRDGETFDPVLDPAAPGYQALVPPSPTLAVLHTGADGSLVGVVVLALAGEDAPGGAVILVPPATLASIPEFGDLTLEYVQQLNGTDTTFSLLEWIIGIGIDDVVVLDDAGWTELVEPIGPLTITNPDEVRAADGTLLFPSGPVELEPQSVGAFLTVLGPGENPINRVLRQELVWSGWLAALADAPGVVELAGEQDRGLARFAPAIAAGNRRIVTLPVTAMSPLPDEPTVYLPDDDAIAAMIPELVPFPAGARPGDRPLVRVVDGSGRPGVITPAVRTVARSGGQVVMIGNADAFGEPVTELYVAERGLEGFARSVADALGVGSVQVVEHIDENAEVIIVLGEDYQP